MKKKVTFVPVKVPHIRTTWSQAYIPSRKHYDDEIVVFSGVQQTADFSSFETLSPVSNPNWKTLASQGKDASNAYSRSGFIRLKPARFYGEDINRVTLTRGRVRIVGTAGSGVVSLPDDAGLRDQALKRVKDKLNSEVSQVKAMIPIGELREMRGQITAMANLSIRFVTLWREIVHGRYRSGLYGVKEITRQASDAWLTYAFGIRPMVSDVQAISEAIVARLESSARRIRLTGSASSEERQRSAPTSTGTNNANVNFVKATVADLGYRYVLGADLGLLSTNDYGVMAQFGFTTEDIPSLGWELFPFSWILDYFTTAGDYFDDTFVMPPGVTKYLVLCTRRTSRTVITPAFITMPNVDILKMSVDRGLYEYFSFSRQKLTSLPHRAFRVKSVDEIGKSAVNKLLNLSSLIGSGLKR